MNMKPPARAATYAGFRLAAVLALCAGASTAMVAASLGLGALSHEPMVIWPLNGFLLALMLGPLRRRALLTLVTCNFTVVAYETAVAPGGAAVTFTTGSVAFLVIMIDFLVLSRLKNQNVMSSGWFLRFIAVVSSGAAITSTSLAIALHILFHAPPVPVFLTGMASDVVGCAVLTPLLLILTTTKAARPQTGHEYWRDSMVLLGYFALAVIVFTQSAYPLLFLIPIALMGVAYTTALASMAVAVLATAVIAMATTISGHGPMMLVHGGGQARLIMLQIFLAVISSTSLPIAALMAEHARLKRSLVSACAEAEAANRAKSAFLATMSHEIRTPLNGVLGMAQVIAMDDLSPTQRERIGVVRQSGETLLAILNEVLDLAKIEAGKLTLEAIEFDLKELLVSAVRGHESLARDKGLTLRVDIEAAEGLYRGDPTRLRQIVSNLLSNALKFTLQGSIDLDAAYDGENVRIGVNDTGIGIPADKLGKLFGKFSQMDDSTTRRFGGTGLGLSICRQLAELMGGSIAVESSPGVGSRFTLLAPLPRLGAGRGPTSALADTPESYTLDQPLRVLAAEDNPTNQLVLKTLLELAGAEVVIVGDGAQAVQAWADEDWDVVLMDVQMPVLDGPSATREIRRRETAERRGHTPIIALTANTMSHQVAEYMASGMDGHLGKPIEASALFDALDRIGDGAEPLRRTA